ncbi:MAG TPA: AbrB/MazE/SpoVT family DNA-binding domain-containing protein [Candidatus Nanoarchaeia archaeon]|nr:AbrB/MazE/SpoVT family DNA-binding domain-containing protein [Candidatus Nanoarchaeia archaeon]
MVVPMPEMFKSKIRKIGSSYGLIVPKKYLVELHIEEGEEVEVGLLKERRLTEIEKACGITKGAKPFIRNRQDREF